MATSYTQFIISFHSRCMLLDAAFDLLIYDQCGFVYQTWLYVFFHRRWNHKLYWKLERTRTAEDASWSSLCVHYQQKNLKYRLSPELVKSKGQAVSGAVTAARKQHVFPHHQQMDVQERTPCLHVSSRMSGSPSLPMKVQLLSRKITGCLPSNEKQLCSQ